MTSDATLITNEQTPLQNWGPHFPDYFRQSKKKIRDDPPPPSQFLDNRKVEHQAYNDATLSSHDAGSTL